MKGSPEWFLGKEFDLLTVVGRSDKRGKYKCICDCGRRVEKTGGYLLSFYVKSCGCVKMTRAQFNKEYKSNNWA